MAFLVFADDPTGAAGLSALDSPTVLTHRSGRPWIAGSWSPEELVYVEAGPNRVALLGLAMVDEKAVAERLEQARTPDDLDDLARRTPGCFHLIASINGTVRVQGSLSATRQVFFAEVAGQVVAGDRPEVVAMLAGSAVDTEQVALQLLAPYGPPWPLSGECAWKGVASVPPGSYLRTTPDGLNSVRRWWSPPEPELPLEAAVPLLREVLTEAVGARVRRAPVLSADLSGGQDSTSLCFLAAGQGASLVTVHQEAVDPSNEDSAWARRCHARLPGAEHLRLSAAAAPGPYSDLTLEDSTDLDGVFAAVSRPMVDFLARNVSAGGSRMHLQGHGGDQLFRPSPLCLRALARRHPLSSLGRLRAERSMRRWTVATTLRHVWGGGPYHRWLAGLTDRLRTTGTTRASTDWEIAPSLPSWVSADCVQTVRRLLREAAAERPAPISPLEVQHEMVRLVQVDGGAVRRSCRIGARYGVSFEAPYLDDRVLQAGLSVRLEDRMAPNVVKPVLAAVMRGIAPDDLLDRRDKGDVSAELFEGLSRHRAALERLCEESHLVRMGLVDATAFRRFIFGLHTGTTPFVGLGPTLNAELWLRSLPAGGRAGSGILTTSQGA